MKSTEEIINTLRTYDEWSVDEINEAADRLDELHKGMVDIHRWYERSVICRHAGDPPETCCRILNQVDGIAKRCMK